MMPSKINNTESNLKKKSVLVVEDDPDVLFVITDLLSDSGLAVIGVDSVPQALEKVKNQRFDCIVTDIRLGAETSEKIIKHVREKDLGLNVDTPIIVCSGYIDQGLISRYGKMINYAVVKPFTMEFFVEKILHWVEQKHAS